MSKAAQRERTLADVALPGAQGGSTTWCIIRAWAPQRSIMCAMTQAY